MTAVVSLVEAYDEDNFPENFYRGVIVRLERGRGRGLIRSRRGREVFFQFPFVSVVGAPRRGPMPGIELLHVGDEVGFDVGWTSRGLRATRIKPAKLTPEEAEAAQAGAATTTPGTTEREPTSGS